MIAAEPPADAPRDEWKIWLVREVTRQVRETHAKQHVHDLRALAMLLCALELDRVAQALEELRP